MSSSENENLSASRDHDPAAGALRGTAASQPAIKITKRKAPGGIGWQVVMGGRPLPLLVSRDASHRPKWGNPPEYDLNVVLPDGDEQFVLYAHSVASVMERVGWLAEAFRRGAV